MDDKQKLLLILAIGAGVFYFSGDTGYDVGTPPCDLQCDSCSDCIDALNNDTETYVCLNTSISNFVGTCINNPANFTNKTFDCQGYTIDGDDTGNDRGIYFAYKKNNTIKNCIISDFLRAIELAGPSDAGNSTLTNNTITSNVQIGIYVWALDNASIRNNNISSNSEYGIYVENIDNGSIFNNTISSHTGGEIYLNGVTNTTVLNNTLKLGNTGIKIELSNNNIIENNTFINVTQISIYILNSGYNNITTNDVDRSWYGLKFENSNYSVIYNNTIKHASVYGGVFFNSLSTNNNLTLNEICKNKLDVSDSDSNFGDDNTCDITSNWNDTGTTGCTNSCPIRSCTCDSCANCSAELYSDCQRVNLSTDIIGNVGSCINITTLSNVVFNCDGHIINGTKTWGDQGLYALYSSNIEVRNCIFANNQINIFGYQISNSDFINNTASNSTSYGIYLSVSDNNSVINNSIENNDYNGIYLSGSANNNITQNNISGGNKGIYLLLPTSSDNKIADNHINSKIDIALAANWEYGSRTTSLNNTLIDNNTFLGSVGVHSDWVYSVNITSNYFGGANGIMFSNTTNSFVSENELNTYSIGIDLVSDSVNNQITNNNLTNSGIGISVRGNSDNTSIYNNSISEKKVGVSVMSNNNSILDNNVYNCDAGVKFSNTSRLNETVFVITFDDGRCNTYRVAYTVMDEFGFDGVVYFNGEATEASAECNDPSDYSMTKTQATELQTNGWQISSHSWQHVSLTTLNATEIDYQLETNKNWLISNNFTGYDYLAYPYGNFNELVVTETLKYHKYGRSIITKAYDSYPFTDYQLVQLIYGNPPSTLEVTSLAGRNTVVILLFHDVEETAFRSLLTAINSSGVVRTFLELEEYEDVASSSSTLSDNNICYNGFDINNTDVSNSGDDNTCFSTSGWNDTGTVGCSFDCINFCNLTYDVNYEDVVRGYVENKVWAKAGNSISMFDFQNNTTSSFSMNTTIIPTLSVDMNKTVNKSQVYKNSTVKYNFTVINTGDAVLTCSIYDDDVYWISSYEDLNTAFSSWKYNSYKPDYHVFTIPVEGNRTFFANRGIISTLTNNASVSCLFKNYTVSDYDTETVYVCHLTVTKSVNQTVVEQGGVVSYNITVFNDGDCNMTNITAVDSSDVDIPVIALMAPGESLSCIYNYSFTNLSLITNCTWS